MSRVSPKPQVFTGIEADGAKDIGTDACTVKIGEVILNAGKIKEKIREQTR